jgi:small GTP-binding protein
VAIALRSSCEAIAINGVMDGQASWMLRNSVGGLNTDHNIKVRDAREVAIDRGGGVLFVLKCTECGKFLGIRAKQKKAVPEVKCSNCGQLLKTADAINQSEMREMSERGASMSASVGARWTVETVTVLLVGRSGAGKTCALTSYKKGEYVDGCIPSIGTRFESKPTTVGDLCIQGLFWDTAGRNRYDGITRGVMCDALIRKSPDRNCVMLLFCMASEEGFRNARELWDTFNLATSETPVLLVGTKVDLCDGDGAAARGRGEALAVELNANGFIATSSMTRENLVEAFEKAARIAYKLFD